MSLTEAERVFGGITETGVNDLIRAFFTARPRYLNYGSPGFVSSSSAAATQMGAIPFPGVPGGIDWAVQLQLPKVDLHPESDPLPPELSLSLGRLSVATTVRICVACETRREPERDEERPDDEGRDDDYPKGKAKGTCFEFDVFAVAHPERRFSPDSVIIVVDAVEIVDIEPTDLESVLECLTLQVLKAVMAEVELPMDTLRAGAFSLSLTRGPEVENDQLEIYGNL